MELQSYYNKNVTIIDIDGQTFAGVVSDYFFADENESGKESIVLESKDGDLVEFTENEIKEIIIN